MALGIMSFAAIVILGILPTGLTSSQRANRVTVGSRLAAEVQSELQQVGLSSFATTTTSFDVEGRIVTAAQGTTAPVYDVYRSVQSGLLPGVSGTNSLKRILVQVVDNPARRVLTTSTDGSVEIPPGMEASSYPFYVVAP